MIAWATRLLPMLAGVLYCACASGGDDGADRRTPAGGPGSGFDNIDGGLADAGRQRLRGQGCASAEVHPIRLEPTVWFLIDGSGSMDQPFADSDRWNGLRQALIGTGGVIPALRSEVEFGVLFYDGPIADSFHGGTCPRFVTVEAGPDRLAAIESAYPQLPPGGSTPTHQALERARSLVVAQRGAPDAQERRVFFVLATDGKPNDSCSDGFSIGGRPAQPLVLEQTELAFEEGVRTFVVSLAEDDVALTAHLTEVAAAGGTGTAPFVPSGKGDLVAALSDIIDGALGCEVVLDGTVELGYECLGYVELNGNDLPCDDPDGWRLKDPRTVEFTGEACAQLLSDPDFTVEAGFPCEIFSPQ